MGTVDYMSPEQAFDPRLADARSDIYSLGCTLYYPADGEPALCGASLMQRLLAHRDQPVPSVRYASPRRLDRASTKCSARWWRRTRRIVPARWPNSSTGSKPARPPRAPSTVEIPVHSWSSTTASASIRYRHRQSGSDAPEAHVDPTPLPRLVTADLDNSAKRLGHPPRRQKAQSIYTIYETDIPGFRLMGRIRPFP